jgi:hypothetical protein
MTVCSGHPGNDWRAAIAVTADAPAECVLCVPKRPSGKLCVCRCERRFYRSIAVLIAACGDIKPQDDNERTSSY